MKIYQKSKDLDQVKLGKGDLIKLGDIISSSFPNAPKKHSFEVLTNLPDVSITENSIKDFLSHEDLPGRISILSIRAYGWSADSEIDKAVYLTLYKNFGQLTVSGNDQTWVLGKYTQITDFLRQKRPRWWLLDKVFPFISGFGITLLALMVLTNLIKANETIYAISLGTFLISWIAAAVLNTQGKFMPYVQIVLVPQKRRINAALIVGICSLGVAIAGMIRQFFQ